jgi:hypothetical protein
MEIGAGVTQQSRMLIAYKRSDGNVREDWDNIAMDPSNFFRIAHYARKGVYGDPKRRANRRRPIEGINIHQIVPGCVRAISNKG